MRKRKVLCLISVCRWEKVLDVQYYVSLNSRLKSSRELAFPLEIFEDSWHMWNHAHQLFVMYCPAALFSLTRKLFRLKFQSYSQGLNVRSTFEFYTPKKRKKTKQTKKQNSAFNVIRKCSEKREKPLTGQNLHLRVC